MATLVAPALMATSRPDGPAAWERLHAEGESAKSFQAFSTFRDLPPEERSLAAAYRQKSGKEQAKQAPGAWTGWYTIWRWKDRVAAWDRHQDRARQAQRARELQAYRHKKSRIGAWLTAQGLAALQASASDGLRSTDALKLVQAGLAAQGEALGDSPDAPDQLRELEETYVERIRRLRLERGLD